MANSDLQMKAMDVLLNMYTAIKNVQLYETGSPIIANSVERLYMHLQDILKQESPLVFAESEKQALLRGIVLSSKDQQTAHVLSLLDILHDFGLQSISFDKGLLREELNTFIKLLAKNPKAVHFDGGLPRLVRENKITHIHTDKKTYTLVDQNKETSRPDIKNDAVAQPDAVSDDPVSQNITDMMNALNRLEQMNGNVESFSSQAQRDQIRKLSGTVIEWITAESATTPYYKKICQSTQKLVGGLIKHKLFSDAIPIMDVFIKIHNGTLVKDDQTKAISQEMLRHLASEDNINILFHAFQTNENNQKNEAGQILAGFGNIIVNKLLDVIRDSSDSKERVRMIHLIEEMGQKAIAVISERVHMDAPWYFLRNLAYILGRIGNETSADILRPFLLYKDKRVRMEALKSIIQTGGNQKGSILLSVLPQADQDFRINIIETLGKIKYAEAVPELLDMLKSKTSMDKAKQIAFHEKICDALGAIGSTKAIPVLSEITESKSFLGISSYPVETKYAAKRALTSIQRKQEDMK